MLTAELKVNGTLIGVLYIHNMGPVGRYANGTRAPIDLYKYETIYHAIGNGEKPTSGEFQHFRISGATVCVQKTIQSLKAV